MEFMYEALKEAEEAGIAGEIPVGAVIVKDGTVIGRGRNRREELRDSTAHAEIMAIRDAEKNLGDWRLNGCTLYVTLEPCVMCSGAIVQARLDTVVFGARDPEAGCCFSKRAIPQDRTVGGGVRVIGGMLEEECSDMLKKYFEDLRK